MTNRQQILSQRGDLSPFLIHLTRDGLFSTDPTQPKTNTLSAKKSLETIIGHQKIIARSAMGYFNYHVAWPAKNRNMSSRVQRSWLFCCSFTETPLDHIKIQFQPIQGRNCQFKNYGLAFFESTVRKRGGNPIFYTDTRHKPIRDGYDEMAKSTNCIDYKGIMPFVEGLTGGIVPFVDVSTAASLTSAKTKLGALPQFKGLKL